jgi:hypothetical protein
MKSALRARFWLETGLSSLCACVFLVTLVWRDWIEALTGADPDQHSGSVEWAIVLTLFVVSLAAGVLARSEWRRDRLAAARSD